MLKRMALVVSILLLLSFVTITSTRLIESFVQKDYRGEWIKGVKFLYNGKPIDALHVPDLSQVSYRSRVAE